MKKKNILTSILSTLLVATICTPTSEAKNFAKEIYFNETSLQTEDTLIAKKWNGETDIPGLGLNNINSTNAYTVLCEDGLTTLGLYYYYDYNNNKSLYVIGINTTASEISLPHLITVDGSVVEIKGLGYSGYTVSDWSGATNLREIHTGTRKNIYADFNDSNITNLHIGNNCSLNKYSGNSNIYLHIPYGTVRRSYKDKGFKRVLVGDEQPEYPVPTVSDWVIAGKNHNEYFGITYNKSIYYISEIFTEKDSIELPIYTPTAEDTCSIEGLGFDSYFDYGTLCKNASNLKKITVPETYNSVNISWDNNPITDLNMQGDVPKSQLKLPKNINVYTSQPYFMNYYKNSSWNNANILPDGWDFEWLTVNVKRMGEFAQTYIEMTDANWDLGKYVKVTGSLNSTDLNNIKKLTNLIKLDLCEAEFTWLPESFLSSQPTLKEIVFPVSLLSIPAEAFSECTQLQKVVAEGVRTICNKSFYECYKLTDFNLENVTYIDSYSFAYCTAFNPTKFSSDLKFLGEYAFRDSGIKEATIPEGISTIESCVFYNCVQLQKVILPNSITTIGASAFEDCTNLVDIHLSEGITTIEAHAFNNCNKITEITLPSTLQTIEYGVLSNCNSLLTVKCKATVPPATNGSFTYNIDRNHCTLYIAPFAIDAYRSAENWNQFYLMKPLNEPVKNIYINRPTSFNLQSEDNAVLQENPNMTLDYTVSTSKTTVGQLSASGDGTLSAGIFSIRQKFSYRDDKKSDEDLRVTLVNNAENMRADSVICSIEFRKNYWHFISFQYDVKMEDIFGLNNTDFVIRRYNSANRASGDGTTSNWEQLSTNDVLEAGKGYIIKAANNSKDRNGYDYKAIVCFPSRNSITKNKLFASNNVIVPLEEYPAEFAHNRSWNLVGNPYPCYYDMHYLMDDFSTPIVFWRGSNYQAYSPIDDDIILRPNEAFFVQRPLDTEEMLFGADGRIHYNQAVNRKTTPGSKVAPMRTKTSQRSVFNFNVEGCGSNDRTRIVMNEDAAIEYELNCDASKFFSETPEGVEFYVDGAVKYDICERPLAEGTAQLGLRITKTGEYSISLDGKNYDGWNVLLKDNEMGNLVDLTKTSYTFTAKAGTLQKRFELTFKSPEPTSVTNTIAPERNDHVSIINTAGVVIYKGNLDKFKNESRAGIYIVVDSGKAYKIVVK